MKQTQVPHKSRNCTWNCKRLFQMVSVALVFSFISITSAQTKMTKRVTKPTKRIAKPTQRTTKPTKRTAKLTQRVTKPTKLTPKLRKTLFEQGNKFYNKGLYGQAMIAFRKIAKDPKWKNFSVYYNLGNSYFKLQQYGTALAFYRKAQRLRPNDLNLLHNTQLLYQRVGKSEQSIPRLKLKFLFWYYLLNLKQLFSLVLLMTFLGLAFWAFHIHRATRRQKSGFRWYVAAWMSVVLMLWASLGIKVYQEELRQVGVVTQERITARSGYGAQFEPLFRLSQADEVLIKERVKVTNAKKQEHEWLRIEIYLYDKQQKRRIKQIGWIPSRSIEEI